MPTKSPGIRGHHDVPEEQQGTACKAPLALASVMREGTRPTHVPRKKLHGGEKKLWFWRM